MTKNSRRILATTVVMTLITLASLPANAETLNLFLNGSMNGPTDTFSLVPAGWTNLPGGTTDTVDGNGHPFASSFEGIGLWPYARSADGGTFAWSGNFAGLSAPPEGLRQTVSGLTVGMDYIISFEYTNLALYDEAGDLAENAFLVGQNYDSSGRWLVAANGAQIGATAVVDPFAVPGSQDWLTYSVFFTATQDEHTFDFIADWVSGSGTHVGMGIDRATLSAIPLPGAAWLLASGLLGLVGVIRRRTERRLSI